MALSARDRLIVALDLASVAEAERAVVKLGDAVSFYKIGYELALAGGIPFAADLGRAGKKVFLDLKLHDIGNTVTRATERAAELGVTFLTVHAFPQTMRAAAEGRGKSGLKILAVTVLTSWDDADVREAGYSLGLGELVAKRADQARAAGIDGLIAAPVEAAALRKQLGKSTLIVTPGIRPASASAGDQKRTMTPADAIKAGADYMVVGRPILAAADPSAAAQAVVAEIEFVLK
ncbi:MAG: orotidine-5'-phosphate decarboxylase [Xanthobacteraceae bacterium]